MRVKDTVDLSMLYLILYDDGFTYIVSLYASRWCLHFPCHSTKCPFSSFPQQFPYYCSKFHNGLADPPFQHKY